MSNPSDKALEAKVDELRKAVDAWLKHKDLSPDYWLKSYIDHFDDEPAPIPYVLLLCHENELTNSPDLMDELRFDVTSETGFLAESLDHTILGFYVDDDFPELQAAFQKFYEWKWLSRLIEASYFDLNSEIFEYIAKNPNYLRQISPRAFESFLDAVFRNNGYRTVLGPGSGDGGVDIRLYGNDVIGEIVTLVQARRYAPHRPIGLEAVQALTAIIDDENANRGLFITTSRYLPCARRFALRENSRIQLADSVSVSEWSKQASISIERDKSLWTTSQAILKQLAKARESGGIEGIYIAEVGYNTISHQYALLLQKIGGTALFMKIPADRITGDHFRGTDIPRLTESVAHLASKETVFRAIQKKDRDSFWGECHLWIQYDGCPRYFDYLD
jgi:hypothetical protein